MNEAFDERHEHHPWNWLHKRLHNIEHQLKHIMATQTELAADLKAVLAQQQKTAGEITAVQASVDTLKARIVDLEGQIAAGGTVSQELVDAVAAVKAQAQIVDDLNPDATP